MPSATIEDALVTRWNALGLNTSIATLYPGDWGAAPESSATLPRAEYETPADTLESQSRGSEVIEQIVQFKVWGMVRSTVRSNITTILSQFVNGDRAATNPMSLSTGTILNIDRVYGTVQKVDDKLFEGTCEIMIRWRRVATVPA